MQHPHRWPCRRFRMRNRTTGLEHPWGCCTGGLQGADLGKQNPPERPLAGALAARHRAGDSGRRNLPIGRWGCCIVGGGIPCCPRPLRVLPAIGGDVAELAASGAAGIGGDVAELATPGAAGHRWGCCRASRPGHRRHRWGCGIGTRPGRLRHRWGCCTERRLER